MRVKWALINLVKPHSGICLLQFQGGTPIFPLTNVCLFLCVFFVLCYHLHSCCFLVLVVCGSGGCLLCMLCFLHELFSLIYDGRSFNVVTYGPWYRVAEKNKLEMRWLHDIVRYYILSKPFNLANVIECSSWFSYIHWLYCMQNEKRKRVSNKGLQ